MDKICKSFFKFPYFCVLRPTGAHKLKIEFGKKRDLEKSQAEPVRRLRLTAAGETSLDLDLVALGKDLLPLGQNELQHPVLIGGPDGVLLDAVQGEGPGEAAGAALPADVVVGGGAVIALTYLCGTRDYNGAGMDLITAAVEQGTARPEAFLLKILFTAVTLSAGFKGGEVVPSFFVGATFGCVAGPLLGIPAGFAAALGLAAVFCGATNCPLASIFLSVELFGDGGLLYFALICGISYMLSGYNGLYSSQTIVYSKLKAQYINVRTNAYHAGEPVPPFQQGGGEETERD